MNKKIYISVLAALMTGLVMTSCSDFLEAENKTAGGQTADDYFGKDPNALLTATYSSLKSIAFSTDLYNRGTDLYIHTRSKSSTEFDTYDMTPESTPVKNFYSNIYKTINLANGVISYAAEGSDEVAEARFLRNYGYYLLTQHFGGVPYITKYINDAEKNYPRTPLAEVYQNVIEDLTDLYNNSSLKAQDHTGRASKQAVAALLAKVTLAAGWDLNTTLNDASKGTYSVNGNDYFVQAAAWAEKAINGVSLSMSFADKWSPFNEGNAEEIFSVQYERAGYPDDITSGGHSMQNCFGGYYGTANDGGMKAVSSEDQQSMKSMYLFEEGDQRYEATYMTTFYNATKSGSTSDWGNTGYYAYYNLTADQLKTYPIAKKYFPYWYTKEQVEAYIAEHKDQLALKTSEGYANDVRIALLTLPNVIVWQYDKKGNLKSESQAIATYNAQTSNGVCVKKFDDPASDQVGGDNDYRDIVLFHVSDMYLIAAEAYLMAGQTAQALTKVNAVRQRAGLTALASFNAYTPQYSTSASFNVTELDVILDERARELYAEGHRWMDLRRTKQLVRYNVEFSEYIGSVEAMSNQKGEIKWLRPIPANEISANTAMSNDDQNPGY